MPETFAEFEALGLDVVAVPIARVRPPTSRRRTAPDVA